MEKSFKMSRSQGFLANQFRSLINFTAQFNTHLLNNGVVGNFLVSAVQKC